MAGLRKETFEAQSEAVDRLLNRFRSQISDADQKHLGCAAVNLSELGAVRKMFMEQSETLVDGEKVSDRMASALVQLLHLPVPE